MTRPVTTTRLQAKLDKRFTNGLQFVAHYTWSKNLTHDGGYANIDPQVNYGPDDFNRKHVFSVSCVYELPFGKRQTIHGQCRPGVEFADRRLPAQYHDELEQRPARGARSYNECNQDEDVGICRPILVGSLDTGGRTLRSRQPTGSPSVPFFTPVAALTNQRRHIKALSSAHKREHLGSGRNAFTGPSFFNSDMSLFKNFAITERVGAQFRFEAFNVFNHVNLNNPNNCIDCGGSGLITSLAPNAQMRQLNFGMKVTF